MADKPLIIIESPGKIKAIQKYSEGHYDVVATNGGIKDLPDKDIGIKKYPDGSIDYSSIRFQATERGAPIISKLKKLAKGRDVYIATDPDREGEAIAYDVYGEIKNVAKSASRVEFHEITPKGIKEGLSNPKQIDLKMVEAQRARRLIDRLVGYELTQHAAHALAVRLYAEASVGRTQSAALKLVYDRDEKIRTFQPEPYWKVVLQDDKGSVFSSKTYKDESEANALKEAIENGEVKVSVSKKEKTEEKPPSPLDASKLQQTASKKFGFPLSKTMEIAQKLYERGLITYMRTDSTRVSEEAQAAARKYLADAFGDRTVPKTPIKTGAGSKKGGAPVQDAHEAVRPSHVDTSGSPERVKATNTDMPPDYMKLYGMIWDIFLASQSVPAVYDKTTVEIVCDNNATLSASGKVLVQPGWREIMNEASDKESEKGSVKASYTQGQTIETNETKINKDFTKPPQHYTLDTFVAELKTHGIGRPGTNARMMDTLYNRRYIENEGKYIVHTDKGRSMVAWLEKVCPQIAEKGFTGRMEEDLDKVSKGESRKENVVNELNHVLNDSVKIAKDIPNGSFRDPGVDYSNLNTRSNSAPYKAGSGTQKSAPKKTPSRAPSTSKGYTSAKNKSGVKKPSSGYKSGYKAQGYKAQGTGRTYKAEESEAEYGIER